MTKLIFAPESNRILGVGIARCGAGELIVKDTLAIQMSSSTEGKIKHSQ